MTSLYSCANYEGYLFYRDMYPVAFIPTCFIFMNFFSCGLFGHPNFLPDDWALRCCANLAHSCIT